MTAVNNLVKKHMDKINTPKTFDDRKKKQKSGYTKHKKALNVQGF